jgi:hypothetical protein
MNYLIIIQFVIYLTFSFLGPIDQISDGESYRIILNELFNSGGIYPNSKHIFNNYINNPGAVNIYLLLMKLFNVSNIRILFILNAFLISLGNFLLIKIIKNSKNKLLFFLITTCYLSNLSLVNTISSDILSYFLICLGIFILSEKSKNIFTNHVLIVLIGFFIGFFDYVRPVGGLFLYSILITLFVVPVNINLKFRHRLYSGFILVVSFFLFKTVLAEFHSYKTGYKINGSIATGYNLLMGTGVGSDGSWTSGVFNPGGKGFFNEIKYTNVEIKNKRWTKQSIDTIISNPTNFIVKGFKKLSLTFGYDLLAIQNLTSPQIKDLSLGRIIENPRLNYFNWFIVILNNIVYFIVLACFFFKLLDIIYYNKFQNLIFVETSLLFFLFFYLMVIYVVIGGARYHHIVMPLMLYFNFQGSHLNLYRNKR